MPPTFQEPRPTPVTVIGWAWIVIGALMLVSATISFIASMAVGLPAPPPPTAGTPELPFSSIWKWFPVLVAGQCVFSIVGIVAGRGFLALQARARTTLEILSWILCVLLIAFAVSWIANWAAVGSSDDPFGPGMIGAVMGVLICLMYGAPVGLMIYHLRSPKVRAALEQRASDAQPESQ
ncbi:sodium/proton-translocating pyrophosphatase [Enhygromyxa salina]|nr:sodium/proton-translocating pyrophosphatase [Enhygromyxa salina]